MIGMVGFDLGGDKELSYPLESFKFKNGRASLDAKIWVIKDADDIRQYLFSCVLSHKEVYIQIAGKNGASKNINVVITGITYHQDFKSGKDYIDISALIR